MMQILCWIVILFGLAVMAWLACGLALLAKEKSLCKKPLPPEADVLMVLGVKMDSPEDMGPLMRSRLHKALELYRLGLAPRILLSGGQVKGEHCPEAQAMAEYLQEKGVPSSALLLENASRNTWKNFELSKPLLLSLRAETIVLVTSDYHLFRSMHLAKRHGLEKGMFPAAANTPGVWLRFLNRQREMLGWGKYVQCEIQKRLKK